MGLEMRVVAGKYRSKNLASPKDDKIRPTTTRIKETLFNVIQGYVEDSVVLDLFAGSGALGIECISRGAKDVTFVDRSHDAINLIYQNLNGIKEKCQVVNADFLSALRNAYVSNKKYDLIFIDPPYHTSYAEIAISTIIELDLLAQGGIIIYEHGNDKTFALDDNNFKVRTKKMGTIVAEFISRKSIALMTGSFDPFTKGHEAVLDEALRDYDEVWVACLVNPDKQYTFNSAQRLKIVERVCAERKGAFALYSEKYAVEVAKEVNAQVLIRGIRGSDDLDYENEMAEYNLEHGFSTRYIQLDDFREVSSSKVREEIERGDYRNIPTSAIALMTSEEFINLK